MPDEILLDEIGRNWEEEGLFARNVNGQLIRFVEAKEKEYTEIITVVIDGEEIQVPLAVPTTDAQGNVVFIDAAGHTKPRKTTIYDAALKLAEKRNPQGSRAQLAIPTICHAEHLRPVGVCRVCSVEVARREKDPNDPTKMIVKGGGKLVPACVQPVEKNMVVHTLRSDDEKAAGRVKTAVKVLLELLAADHLPTGDTSPPEKRSDLARLVERLGPELKLDSARLAPHQPLAYATDSSSPLIQVDHNACILCDRCSRACTDIKENFVIGRSGKGYSARIGFDLNDQMGQSSCVECGECMLSCPTTALTFRKPIVSEWWEETIRQPGRSAVTPEQMENDRLLRTLPFRYRQWNQSSVVRWQVKAGDELCVLGDHGSTAFILTKGRFGVWRSDPRAGTQRKSGGLLGMLSGLFSGGRQSAPDLGQPTFTMTPDDVILGEMTCLNHYPRTATVRALEDGEVYEIRRNVLFTLQRNPEARQLLDGVYRSRALSNHLAKVPFFAGLSMEQRKECQAFLQDKVRLLRLEPGQNIFRQGELADAFYMIRIGFVKISQTVAGTERVINYLGPDKEFGEIGLIADWPEIKGDIPEKLDQRRTANCTALDDVELVAISKHDFRDMLGRFPLLKSRVIQEARKILQRPAKPAPTRPQSPILREFTEQGLYNANKLLVLDLEACTRCDECTKACADTHDGVPRLIRDGLRFDKWLVASACRSCSDPYCLVGCPVDAIHRSGDRLEIQIESHCIGCGLCASNCPYGNINMHSFDDVAEVDGRRQAVVRSQATMCDLCHDIVGPHEEVSCVYACPHNAAFRMSGSELLAKVEGYKPVL